MRSGRLCIKQKAATAFNFTDYRTGTQNEKPKAKTKSTSGMSVLSIAWDEHDCSFQPNEQVQSVIFLKLNQNIPRVSLGLYFPETV